MRNHIESQKAAAQQAYIDARNAWNDTRTTSNPSGDSALWAAFCEAKRLCMRFGVRI